MGGTRILWNALLRGEIDIYPEYTGTITREILAGETIAKRSDIHKALGKHGFYAQVDLDQAKAYEYASELMASAAMVDDAQEGFSAFLEKRRPKFVQRP